MIGASEEGFARSGTDKRPLDTRFQGNIRINARDTIAAMASPGAGTLQGRHHLHSGASPARSRQTSMSFHDPHRRISSFEVGRVVGYQVSPGSARTLGAGGQTGTSAAAAAGVTRYRRASRIEV